MSVDTSGTASQLQICKGLGHAVTPVPARGLIRCVSGPLPKTWPPWPARALFTLFVELRGDSTGRMASCMAISMRFALPGVAAPVEGRQNADGKQHAGPGIAERRAGL